VEKKLEIEFLYLDLDSCTRCRATDANLEEGLHLVDQVLQAAGVDVEVHKILVDSEAAARQFRFVSSPTIRVNGQDIARDVRETPCESCTESCGCDGTLTCRVWEYDGKDYNEAPVLLIVSAILQEVYGSPTKETPKHYSVPANLKKFFTGKKAKTCCSSDEKQMCCETLPKSSCRGPEVSRQSASAHEC
jgi:Domain of unknown function (DUF2703)